MGQNQTNQAAHNREPASHMAIAQSIAARGV